MAVLSSPLPCFKTTDDEKHDIEVYTVDLTEYCAKQNWYDSSEIEDAKWIKPEKAIAYINASPSPTARAL